MEAANFTAAEKSESRSQQCQVHVHHFSFRHPRHCPQGIHTAWSNRQWEVLLWGFEATEGRGAFGANVQTSGRTTIGFSTMTTRPLTHHSFFDNSWLAKTLQWFSTPPIRLTSPPATFSYSPRWKYGWKGFVLTRLRRSTQNRKRLSTHSHLRTCRDAWNHGKHARVAVYMPNGTISKETVENRSYGKKFFLMVKCPNFWVAPRIRISDGQLSCFSKLTFDMRLYGIWVAGLSPNLHLIV